MKEIPALLVIDMVKDTFEKALPIAALAAPTIAPIKALAAGFRSRGWPVVFSTDAFHEDDFIFQGKMPPHSLAGTRGAEVIDELEKAPGDCWLPKPRFSAFFNTGLGKWLAQREVTLCAVAGIATHVCVLATVLDAICHGFKAVVLEDCTAAPSRQIHDRTLENYRRNPLYPLLRVMDSKALALELGIAGG
jgi:nicotinamidase-related amidase